MTFICKDLEKTAHFFKYVFGAIEIYSSGEKTFSLSPEKFFKLGNLWIVAMAGDAIEKSYNHIAFEIDEADLPLLEAKIRELNLTILPGRARKQGEGVSLYFYDYDNHLFELHSGDLNTRLRLYNGT